MFTHYDGLLFLTTLDPDDGSICTRSTEFGEDSEAQESIFCWVSAFALLSLFLPVSIAFAAKLSSRIALDNWQDRLGAFSFAPYIYVNPASTTDNNPNNIMNDVKQTGVKYYKLAFITANGCQGIWGSGDSTASTTPVGQDSIKANIDQLHQQGGDVAITFGGSQGQELAQACQDVPSLEKQYQNIINTYQVKHLEFSVISEDATASDRRNQALAALQKTNPGLSITYTFPATTAGLTQDKLQILQNALKDGVKVDVVNIMTFDFGPPSGDMEAEIVSSAQGAETQLASIHISPVLGITPMIGMTDQHETFTIDDANKLRDFAQQHNYQLSMWTIGRDKGLRWRCCRNRITNVQWCCGNPIPIRRDLQWIGGNATTSQCTATPLHHQLHHYHHQLTTTTTSYTTSAPPAKWCTSTELDFPLFRHSKSHRSLTTQ